LNQKEGEDKPQIAEEESETEKDEKLQCVGDQMEIS
jgi:hypothetical protein